MRKNLQKLKGIWGLTAECPGWHINTGGILSGENINVFTDSQQQMKKKCFFLMVLPVGGTPLSGGPPLPNGKSGPAHTHNPTNKKRRVVTVGVNEEGTSAAMWPQTSSERVQTASSPVPSPPAREATADSAAEAVARSPAGSRRRRFPPRSEPQGRHTEPFQNEGGGS